MDASQLLAFDVRTRKIVKTIPAPGVHGVIAVPALGRVFASATDAREVLTINSKTGRSWRGRPQAPIPTGSPTTRSSATSSSPTRGRSRDRDQRPRQPDRDNLARRRGRQRPVRRRLGPRSRRRPDARRHRDHRPAIEQDRASPRTRRLREPARPARRLARDDSPSSPATPTPGSSRSTSARMRVTGNASVGAAPDVLAFDTSLTVSTSRPRAASSQSSPSTRTASQSSGRHFSRPRRTRLRSTHAPTSSTSRCRVARPASPSS